MKNYPSFILELSNINQMYYKRYLQCFPKVMIFLRQHGLPVFVQQAVIAQSYSQKYIYSLSMIHLIPNDVL